jgi:hypothetical protein
MAEPGVRPAHEEEVREALFHIREELGQTRVNALVVVVVVLIVGRGGRLLKSQELLDGPS